MIAPVMIVCGKRYVKLAGISIRSYLKSHKQRLYVITDDAGKEMLSCLDTDGLSIVDIETQLLVIRSYIRFNNFLTIDYDRDGKHDRTYSSLKPLLMHEAVKVLYPEAKYILSLDADTLFTGNILKRVESYLDSVDHRYDLYMVRRQDPRMQCLTSKNPGSGFTLWRRKSKFIKLFIENFNESCTGKHGGSQTLINSIRIHLASHEIDDPFLHFVCPNGPSVRQKMTDEEILELKPAYIHFHGARDGFSTSYERLVKYYRLFYGEDP